MASCLDLTLQAGEASGEACTLSHSTSLIGSTSDASRTQIRQSVRTFLLRSLDSLHTLTPVAIRYEVLGSEHLNAPHALVAAVDESISLELPSIIQDSEAVDLAVLHAIREAVAEVKSLGRATVVDFRAQKKNVTDYGANKNTLPRSSTSGEQLQERLTGPPRRGNRSAITPAIEVTTKRRSRGAYVTFLPNEARDTKFPAKQLFTATPRGVLGKNPLHWRDTSTTSETALTTHRRSPNHAETEMGGVAANNRHAGSTLLGKPGNSSSERPVKRRNRGSWPTSPAPGNSHCQRSAGASHT